MRDKRIKGLVVTKKNIKLKKVYSITNYNFLECHCISNNEAKANKI